MHLSFPRGVCALGKVFAALVRERPWASLRSQGETGKGVRGGFPWECDDETTVRCCALGILPRRLMEMWCADCLLTASLGSGVPA